MRIPRVIWLSEARRGMESIGAGEARARRVSRPRLTALRDRLVWFSAAVAAPHPVLWLAAALIAALDAVWLGLAGIALDPEAPAWLGLAALVLVLAAACLGRVKSDPTLRAMALATAALLAFTLPVAVLHYLLATLALPLADASLARAEAALGFDWPAYLAFLEAHPALNWWLSLAYHTSGPQVGVVVIVLAATRRLGRLWTYVRLFCATLVCVVAVSALLPAAGAYAHYAPAVLPEDRLETVGALWHLDALHALRTGSLHHLALGDIRGLVTFPSFHACLAILTAWALAPVPVIGPLSILLNAAVVVASVGSGGHYLPDILAGLVLALAALAGRDGLKGRLVRAARRPATERRTSLPATSGT